MTDDPADSAKKNGSPNHAKNYEVGYAKPPIGTRFKPGRSGNPKGRPKGSKNKPPPIKNRSLQDIIISEAYRPIKANEGDKQVTMPMASAIVRAIALNAAKGQSRSQKLFTDMLAKSEAEMRQEHETNAELVAAYQMQWDQIFQEHRIRGLPVPNPTPHPDDIKLDPSTGKIIFIGPASEASRTKWEALSDRLQSMEFSLKELQKLKEDPENTHIKHLIDHDIAFEVKLCERLRAALKGWRKRT